MRCRVRAAARRVGVSAWSADDDLVFTAAQDEPVVSARSASYPASANRAEDLVDARERQHRHGDEEGKEEDARTDVRALGSVEVDRRDVDEEHEQCRHPRN